MALKDIKTKIGATNRTHKVTRAMEAVSAVKMRKTQASALAGRPYAHAALSILSRLSGSQSLGAHPLTASRKIKTTALVVITSDKGLAGALNSGVLKVASTAIANYDKDKVRIYAYGRKGEEYFRKRGYTLAVAKENKKDEVELSVMEDLSAKLADEFISGVCDEVIVAYSNFKSTFEQIPAVRKLLPLTIENLSVLVEDIIPVSGKGSNSPKLVSPNAYTVEPSGEDVLGVLIPRLTAVSLYHMLLESKASEHSSRMVAMKNASDKSKEVAHALTREFNKIRQAAITREVSEIVGGREALAI